MAVLTKIIGFLVTNDCGRATKFYRDVLGFAVTGEDEYAVVFDANGTMIRLNKGAISSRRTEPSSVGK